MSSFTHTITLLSNSTFFHFNVQYFFNLPGHWYDTVLLQVDPWWGGNKYTSNGNGETSITDTLVTGYTLKTGAGLDRSLPRSIVFHDSSGARAACATLSPEGK